MHPVQQSSCSCLYTPEGNLPKAIPVVLSILAALGIVLIALGLTGHLPFYAGVIGFTLVCTCVAGVLYAICHPQHEAEPLRMVPIQPPEREERTPEEIYFDSLNMHIFPRLSAEDLGAAAQVCTLWQEAAYDELLWKKHGSMSMDRIYSPLNLKATARLINIIGAFKPSTPAGGLSIPLYAQIPTSSDYSGTSYAPVIKAISDSPTCGFGISQLEKK